MRFGLECLLCGRTFQPGEVEYVCPDHGDEGTLDVVYDYEALRAAVDRDSIGSESMWDYAPLLPLVGDPGPQTLRVGRTPLYDTPRLARRAGLERVWLKDEGLQPTGSLKDRASAMALVKADESGFATVTTASTGNAAVALAGLAAPSGREVVIFVPASIPEAKAAQLLAYGASVFLVDGGYRGAVELCLKAGERFGWYNRTTGYNPYMSEGKKTVAYEVAHQLGWEAPDVIVVSVGDGCILGSLWKGFHDLIELGWVGQMPRMIGVQASGSNFLAEAWTRGEDVWNKAPISPDTVADSISSALPRDRLKAMRAITASDGAFVTVSDHAILAAIPTLASMTGVLAEPAAAASWAGLEAAAEVGLVSPDDRVVVLSTGTGLKDIPAVMRSATSAGSRPRRVPPDIDAVTAVLERPSP